MEKQFELENKSVRTVTRTHKPHHQPTSRGTTQTVGCEKNGSRQSYVSTYWERLALQRCFRCFVFGRIAKACPSSKERSKQCKRCGVEIHIANGYGTNPNCLMYKGKGQEEGSGSSVHYKRQQESEIQKSPQ